ARDAGDVVDGGAGALILHQRITRSQLLAAGRFFLGEVVVVDGQIVLLELREELLELLDLVQFLVLLKALDAFLAAIAVAVAIAAVARPAALLDLGHFLILDDEVVLAEELIALGGVVEVFIPAFDHHAIERQAAMRVALGKEIGEIDAAALD